MLGDVMAAATTIKVNNAIEPTIAHLRKLVDERRRTAVRDRVLDESVWAFSQGAADVGLGLVLLTTASAMASGAVQRRRVGNLHRISRLAQLPAANGGAHAGPPQAGFSGLRSHARAGGRRRRQQHRLQSRPADRDTSHAHTATASAARASATRRARRSWPQCHIPHRRRCARRQLQRAARQLHRVDRPDRRRQEHAAACPARPRTARRRSRATSCGTVGVLDDRAAFLIPPNAAFLPQVPQLISDSVADNIALGIVDDDNCRWRSSSLPCAPTSTRCPMASTR